MKTENIPLHIKVTFMISVTACRTAVFCNCMSVCCFLTNVPNQPDTHISDIPGGMFCFLNQKQAAGKCSIYVSLW